MMGTMWGQHGDDVGMMGQCEDNIGTTEMTWGPRVPWRLCGDYMGMMGTMWGQHGDDVGMMGQCGDNVRTTLGPQR